MGRQRSISNQLPRTRWNVAKSMYLPIAERDMDQSDCSVRTRNEHRRLQKDMREGEKAQERERDDTEGGGRDWRPLCWQIDGPMCPV